jgi:hypothetical protein
MLFLHAVYQEKVFFLNSENKVYSIILSMWPYAGFQPLTTMGDVTETCGKYKNICLKNTVWVCVWVSIILSRYKCFP